MTKEEKLQKEDIRKAILRVLTNHRRSSLEGLAQLITNHTPNKINEVLGEMVDADVIHQGNAEWNGGSVYVYSIKQDWQRRKKDKAINNY